MPTLIDLLHLDRQTMGDNRLADELLAMFVLQLDTALQELPGAPERRRGALAHSLKGTARSLGILAIAECAAALERRRCDVGPSASPGRWPHRCRPARATTGRRCCTRSCPAAC